MAIFVAGAAILESSDDLLERAAIDTGAGAVVGAFFVAGGV
jgi:hypothetical protein